MPVQWDLDDRPASWYTRLYVRGMELRGDQDAFDGAESTLRTALERQRAGDSPPTWLTRRTHDVTTSSDDGMTVWTVRPRRGRPQVRVVYLHGGGYVHPLTPDYWRLVRALAKAPAEVVVPAYPLAPRSRVDDVVPRLVRLVQRHTVGSDLPTVLMGDSAGGALSLVLAQRLDEPHARVVPLCPWLDATLEQPEVAGLDATDPMLNETGLRAAGRWWARPRDPRDPVVSPLNGDLAALPRVDLFVADRDILRPAVDLFCQRAEQAGVDLRVREVTAMFHVWMTRLIPEAARTRRELVGLLREVAEAAPATGSGGPGPV